MATLYLALYSNSATPTWTRAGGWSGTPVYTDADTDPGSGSTYVWTPDISGLTSGTNYWAWCIWDDGATSSNGPISSGRFTTQFAVGGAAAAGITAKFAHSLPCSVGNAAAAGAASKFAQALPCAVGNAAATGVQAKFAQALSCTVGNAVAAGVQASFARTLSCGIGNAVAAGVPAAFPEAGTYLVGNAVAAGVPAKFAASLACGVGNAAAVGVSARLVNSISCTVGTAAASGIAAIFSRALSCTAGAAVANGVQATITLAAAPSLSPEDIAAIADAVWAHPSALQVVVMLSEAWARLGLDITRPLYQDDTQFTFGEVLLAVAEVGAAVTVTRQ